MTNVMTDGRMVEGATIGNEGLIGITVFLGGDDGQKRIVEEIQRIGATLKSIAEP